MHNENACTYRKFNGSCADKDARGGGLCFATFLVGVGSLFLLKYLGMLGSYEVFDFWPLGLMLPALSGIFKARHWAGRVFSVLVFAFADLALVHNLQLFDVPWQLIWPISIVALGVSIMAMVALFPRKKETRFEIPTAFLADPNHLHTKIVCGGKEDDFGTGEFNGASIDIFMGGYKLDLRAARIADSSADLYLKAKLAGVKIRVPQDWKVIVLGETFMGTIEDHSLSRGDDTQKQLNIYASVRQGAVEIDN